MKFLLSVCCLVLLTATAARSANADIRAQKTSDKPVKYALHTSLEIVPDPKATEARLQIPESDVKSFRAALEGAANPPVAAAITHNRTRTIIAGLLMFLSVSIAGILFARSSSFGRTQKALAAVILVVAVIGVAAIITRGNAGPPGSYRWRNLPQALAEGRATAGGVDIEIVADDPQTGGTIRLIIPLKTKQRGEE
jgi:hypothetical protein